MGISFLILGTCQLNIHLVPRKCHSFFSNCQKYNKIEIACIYYGIFRVPNSVAMGA